MSVAPMDEVAPWLTIVGLPAAGVEALAPDARAAIERAEWIAGSARQLALVRSIVHGEIFVWPSPLSAGMPSILARRGRATCVLASGDPFFFGIGATLAPQFRGEFVCHPAPSSLSLAAAKLGWPLQDCDVVSLHGRDLHDVIRYLQPGRRVFALAWDRTTPQLLAALLTERGFARSRLHVLQMLGAPEERVRSCLAAEFALGEVADLNLIAIEVAADRDALIVPCRASVPDDAFEHDGQLTKQEIRALTLSALSPRAGETLWDIGAGAGSIAIEWMLCHPANRAFAIERDPARCERIGRNARRLGVPALAVVHASAPEGRDSLPMPDAIFIGGGSDRAIFERSFRALRPGGRLVMNAVSLETEAQLLESYAAHGGELRRFSIERADKLGSMTGWRSAMPVTQWKVVKT
ncbi:MAG TPA: precorrin-6y C5,15-methyltransferase (decarboxylating) subunit CbiE [Polyangiales bacterium]|nr:precorrin-6y C5,15-methyltransferase (decarboxylating) subunit CbiE [Polyangiales bacterium]